VSRMRLRAARVGCERRVGRRVDLAGRPFILGRGYAREAVGSSGWTHHVEALDGREVHLLDEIRLGDPHRSDSLDDAHRATA
jgi:hypothetical protein